MDSQEENKEEVEKMEECNQSSSYYINISERDLMYNLCKFLKLEYQRKNS